MRCPHCGGKNFNWARRCDHCGKSLPTGSDASIPSADRPGEEAAAIDPPTIPTMPPFNWAASLTGIAGIFVYFQFVQLVEPSPRATLAVIMSIHAGRALFAARRRYVAFRQVRRTIHWLRQFDAEQRATILGTDMLPLAIEHQLLEHGHPEQLGVVDRFTFSPVDCRELRVLTWTAVGGAAAILVMMMALDMSAMMRAIAAVCVVTLCAAALVSRRGLSMMRRVFEVTPFALSEIREDGTIRRIVWGHGVTLRNHAKRRRIEVSTQSAPFRIEIPYSVVGFARLAELIVKKGGFARP
jgi:hypothetical protein